MAAAGQRNGGAGAAALGVSVYRASLLSLFMRDKSVPSLQTHAQPVAEKRQLTGITVSIVILTWNSQAEIAACLSSLGPGLTAYSSEVIVIDNGSQDATCTIVQETLPSARLVCNTTNRGVAPARNQGLNLAQGKYVLILDDDTVVQPWAFDRLIDYLEHHPDVGLCGPKLIDGDGQLQLTCRLFPTLADKLARRLSLPAAQKIAQAVEMADWDHRTVRDVDYVIGACQAIRRSAVAAVGLFDARIFYGPEDVDLCLRLQQAGWRVVYQPAAVVVHHERRLTRSMRSGVGWKHVQGLGYFFWKHGYLLSRRRLYSRLARVAPLARIARDQEAV